MNNKIARIMRTLIKILIPCTLLLLALIVHYWFFIKPTVGNNENSPKQMTGTIQVISKQSVQGFNTVNYYYSRELSNEAYLEGNASLRKQVDMPSFKAINYIYARDKNHVYAGDQILEKANPKSFRMIKTYAARNSGYAQDDDYIFYDGKLVEVADIATFQVLSIENNSGHAIDKNYAYFKGEVIKTADPSTFVLYENDFARDKNHRYHKGKLKEK